MESTSTRENMQSIVKTMGTVNVEQLLRFFRNADDYDKVPYYIKELIAYRVFDYDKARNRVTWHNTPPLKEESITRNLMAFWIVANFGAENIREVYIQKYPTQLFFITTDNTPYDLTVCLSQDEAKTAFRVLRQFQIPGEPDDVNHIAIVRNHEVGKAVLSTKAAQFDSYCILDEQKLPSYYTDAD